MLRLALSAAVLTVLTAPAFALELTSPDVSDGQLFPQKFVCAAQGGENVSPAYAWSGVPAEARSLAITIHDPDAPREGGFWHWLLVDIPPTATGIAQGAAAAGKVPVAGAVPLPNGAGHANYDGPCPPAGKPHHYVTTLYALPMARADVNASTPPGGVGDWLAKHAIAKAVMTPVFAKK